jgi:hypothetical protein
MNAKFRKLRIASSVAWGVVAVLLFGLWVRSYSKNDIITRGMVPGPGYMFSSVNGELSVARFKTVAGGVSKGWSAWTNPSNYPRSWRNSLATEFLGFRYWSFFVAVPHWSIVLLSATLSALPWLQWRFSLRTLLIVTTVVALLLGVIVVAFQ